ncbi:MAG: hypothetical protein ACI8UO_000965 [Verrucomicrobiales bacterium]|jgi:hypothetical protein
MKKRNLFVAACLLAILTISGVVWVNFKKHDANEERKIDSPLDILSAAPEDQIGGHPYYGVVTKSEEAIRPENVSKYVWYQKIGELRFLAEMNAPCVFFGKMVDQNRGKGIEGVAIEARISFYEGSIEKLRQGGKGNPAIYTLKIVTDENGVFSINEPIATSLTLHNFARSGYDIIGRTYYVYRFEYTDGHIADSSEPVLFYMTKDP